MTEHPSLTWALNPVSRLESPASDSPVLSERVSPNSTPQLHPRTTHNPPQSQVGRRRLERRWRARRPTGCQWLTVCFPAHPRLSTVFSLFSPPFSSCVLLHPTAHTSLILPCLQYTVLATRIVFQLCRTSRRSYLVAHITSPNSQFFDPDLPTRKS